MDFRDPISEHTEGSRDMSEAKEDCGLTMDRKATGPRDPLAFLVLIRHFNDWDNIAPIVHLLLSASDEVRVTIIRYGTCSLEGDPVLHVLLEEFPEQLTVEPLADCWWPLRAVCRLPKWLSGLKALLYRSLSFAALGESAEWNRTGRLGQAIISKMLGGDRAANRLIRSASLPSGFIVLSDMNRSNQISRLVDAARAAGATRFLGLPVSPYVNANVLRSIRADGLNERILHRIHDYSGFDAVAVVDDLYLQNLRRLSDGIDGIDSLLDRAEIIGSLRYSRSWIARRRALFPTLPKSGRGLRTLVLLSNPDSNVNKDELSLALQMVAKSDGLEVVVKPHTRVSGLPPGLPRTLCVDAESDSSSLIDWAEVVLFVSSSVAIEAIQLGKPSLCLEYLTSNVPSLAFVDGVTRLRCRDDLLHALALLPDRLVRFVPTMPAPSDATFPIERIVKCEEEARQATLSYILGGSSASHSQR
jgi:hypothetical protein